MSLSTSLSQLSINATARPDSPDMPMRTLVFTSQKGGSGKTTLCGQLAVQADLAGLGPVALIDTDPQGSLADWWNSRAAETPMFVRTCVDRLYETLEELRGMGVKLVFIDTQPTVTEVIRDIVKTADLVIIPTRPSPHDLRAVGPTLDLVEKCNKPMVFAINSATRRARITGDVAVALSQHGTVAPVTIHNRTDFATSMINGKTVMEIKPDGASAQEIGALWEYINARLSRLEQTEGHLTFAGSTPPAPEVMEQTEAAQAEAPLPEASLAQAPLPQDPLPQDGETQLHNRRSADPGRRKSGFFGRRKTDGFGCRVVPAQQTGTE